MEIQVFLACANIMQSSIILITLTANVPQWLAIHKSKNSANLSVSSWVMWLTGSFFALFYAIVNQCAYQNSLSLLLTSAVSFLCNFYTIYLIQKYRIPANSRFESKMVAT